MGFILSIYTYDVYREVHLPMTDNADYNVCLSAEDYLLHRNVVLEMEAIDGIWYLIGVVGGVVSVNGSRFERGMLRKELLLKVTIEEKEQLIILVSYEKDGIVACPKYIVLDERGVTIGRGVENDICCGSLQIVSRKHAIITYSRGYSYITDTSMNGVYLNGLRIHDSRKLQFGDRINIYGLTIVYMEEILAVRSLNRGFKVNQRPGHLEQIHGNYVHENDNHFEAESSSMLPNSLTFFEMLGIQRLEELHVLENWKRNRTYESMSVLIGQDAGGAGCYLDIHEKAHGPHGLVAGMTGSGKSEMLRTMILSLSVHFSPLDVVFFIIDYKGNGVGNCFSGLPHMIGQISNFSGDEMRSAVVSLYSENLRRQRLFSEYGVNNINGYTKLVKTGETRTPLPRFLIIIDEYEKLKQEQPEFMKELVNVSQVGRSLGIHLILTTQEPSDIVRDEILWCRMNFKICLRVEDKQDSNDILYKSDAAFLTQSGRGYLQVGKNKIYELFQPGYSGAPYDPEGRCQNSDAMVIDLPGREAVVVRSRHEDASTGIKEKEIKQLDAVVNYLAQIAKLNGYVQEQLL